MTDRDLDEFFKKIGTQHVPRPFRVCNRVQSFPGLHSWTCETLVATDPNIPTLECVQCGQGMIICDCEEAPMDDEHCDVCVACNENCRYMTGENH